jgi:hypothetical protein
MERILPVVRAEAFPRRQTSGSPPLAQQLSHRHPCVTCIADGQSGRTRPGEDQVRPLAAGSSGLIALTRL